MKIPKFHRVIRALPIPASLMVITIIAPLLILLVRSCIMVQKPITTQCETSMPWDYSSIFWIIIVIATVGFSLVAVQTWANYKTQWYDPNLALKYVDIFFGHDLMKYRKKAGIKYKKTGKWTSDVEDVLDILEDLGFYIENQIISRDIAHHFFYYWIRGYIQTADDYIKECRSQPQQELAYEHCFSLLEEVSKVEAKKTNTSIPSLHWNQEDIDKFIEAEINLSVKKG
jgi:hypothetical protein